MGMFRDIGKIRQIMLINERHKLTNSCTIDNKKEIETMHAYVGSNTLAVKM